MSNHTTPEPYSRFAPGADSISVGDEVAIIEDGSITAVGNVTAINPIGMFHVESEGAEGNFCLAEIAHVESDQAQAAAMFGEDLTDEERYS